MTDEFGADRNHLADRRGGPVENVTYYVTFSRAMSVAFFGRAALGGMAVRNQGRADRESGGFSNP